MKLKVDEKNDALYFSLDESAIVESEEVQPGVILEFNDKGQVVGVEILVKLGDGLFRGEGVDRYMSAVCARDLGAGNLRRAVKQ